MLSPEQLRELLDYDPETGVFRWKQRVARRVRVGDVAGRLNSEGYRNFSIRGRHYRASRVAFALVYGRWPSGSMDHINRNRRADRLCNLRECTLSENSRNASLRGDNSSRLKGACRSNGRWQARIRIDGKPAYLGTFSTPELAHAAYVKAAIEHFGEFACGG